MREGGARRRESRGEEERCLAWKDFLGVGVRRRSGCTDRRKEEGVPPGTRLESSIAGGVVGLTSGGARVGVEDIEEVVCRAVRCDLAKKAPSPNQVGERSPQFEEKRRRRSHLDPVGLFSQLLVECSRTNMITSVQIVRDNKSPSSSSSLRDSPNQHPSAESLFLGQVDTWSQVVKFALRRKYQQGCAGEVMD